MKVQKKQEGFKQNGTHRLLTEADNVNLLPEGIQTTKKNKMITSRKTRWVSHVACMEEMQSACRVLVVKPDGNTPLVRPRHR